MSEYSNNLPVSEQYRLIAKSWVDLESAASLLEDTKSAVLAQRMAALGDMPVSRAEMIVRASPEWHEFVTKTNDARRAANLQKVRMEWVKMKFSEQQSAEATARAERRL